MAPIGYFAAPALLNFVNAAPEVQQQALPFLRTMFVGIFGMMMFFMLSGALRAAGDARTPLRLGVSMTVLNDRLQRHPHPAGSARSAPPLGTIVQQRHRDRVWRVAIVRAQLRDSVPPRDGSLLPTGRSFASLFRFGLPTGLQGIAMNVAGVMLLRFIGSLEHSAAAQAAYAVGYTELFSLITWTSVGLMGASSTIAGQNLGAHNRIARSAASPWPRASVWASPRSSARCSC